MIVFAEYVLNGVYIDGINSSTTRSFLMMMVFMNVSVDSGYM